MEDTPQNTPIRSWNHALENGLLSEEQLAVLKDMVDQKQAETIQAAASMLDWQDNVIDPPEHMYGF